jgi:hypothetical protein
MQKFQKNNFYFCFLNMLGQILTFSFLLELTILYAINLIQLFFSMSFFFSIYVRHFWNSCLINRWMTHDRYLISHYCCNLVVGMSHALSFYLWYFCELSFFILIYSIFLFFIFEKYHIRFFLKLIWLSWYSERNFVNRSINEWSRWLM